MNYPLIRTIARELKKQMPGVNYKQKAKNKNDSRDRDKTKGWKKLI